MTTRSFFLLIFAGVFTLSAVAEDSETKDVARPFTLDDVYDQSHTIDFPRQKPLILSVSDIGGRQDAPVWTKAIKDAYGERIEYRAVANLSFVPEMGRTGAKYAIRALTDAEVLCDWDGSISAKLGTQKNAANIVVIARDGKILHHVHGEMTDKKKEKTFAAIETAIEDDADDNGERESEKKK